MQPKKRERGSETAPLPFNFLKDLKRVEIKEENEMKGGRELDKEEQE